MKQIFVDSDTLVQVTSLKDARTLADIDDATITVGVYDNTDTQVGDNVTLNAVGSDGDYYGLLPNDLGLEAGDRYYLIITITSGDTVLTKKIRVEAVYSE